MMDWFYRPILSAIQQLKETMMATKQEMLDAIAKLATDVVAEKQQVADAQAGLSVQISELQAQVVELQAQVASGGVLTAADLDQVLASIQDIDAGVQAIQP
jgi:cob(I)alamin adenosyltransferase